MFFFVCLLMLNPLYAAAAVINKTFKAKMFQEEVAVGGALRDTRQGHFNEDRPHKLTSYKSDKTSEYGMRC